NIVTPHAGQLGEDEITVFGFQHVDRGGPGARQAPFAVFVVRGQERLLEETVDSILDAAQLFEVDLLQGRHDSNLRFYFEGLLLHRLLLHVLGVDDLVRGAAAGLARSRATRTRPTRLAAGLLLTVHHLGQLVRSLGEALRGTLHLR